MLRSSFARSIGWAVCVLAMNGCSCSDDPATPPPRDSGPRDAVIPTGDSSPMDSGGGGTDSGPRSDSGGGGGDSGWAMGGSGFVASLVEKVDATMAGVAPGFNLDGRVSDADTDAMGCFELDYTSPDGVTGVDNEAAGPFGGALDTFSGGDFNATIRTAMGNGDLLVLLQLAQTDCGGAASCEVAVDVARGLLPTGVTTAAVDGMGHLTAGQTFDVDGSSPIVSSIATLTGSDLSAQFPELAISLPFGDATITLRLHEAHLTAHVASATRLDNGVVGGRLDINELAASIAATGMFDMATAAAVLSSFGDLDPADASGTMCQGISVAFVFEAVDADITPP